MSLNWSVTKVKDWEAVCKATAPVDQPMDGIKAGDRVWSAVTQSIVWGCMTTGIGEITDKNALEWWSRYEIARRVIGWEPALTFADVRRHVGLSTNVFPKRTNAAFFAGMMDEIAREEQRRDRGAA